MVKMYTINEMGILQIINVPIKDAIQIMDNCPNPRFIKYDDYKGLKFLTMGEWKECSQMDNDQRKLYYELKED